MNNTASWTPSGTATGLFRTIRYSPAQNPGAVTDAESGTSRSSHSRDPLAIPDTPLIAAHTHDEMCAAKYDTHNSSHHHTINAQKITQSPHSQQPSALVNGKRCQSGTWMRTPERTGFKSTARPHRVISLQAKEDRQRDQVSNALFRLQCQS